MNDFFVNIGPSVESKIPNSKTHFSSYLKSENPNSLFLHACDYDEVATFIKNLSAGKSCGPFSLPVNIIKNFAPLLIKPLMSLINKSFDEGIFPTLLKSARVCPIYKKK